MLSQLYPLHGIPPGAGTRMLDQSLTVRQGGPPGALKGYAPHSPVREGSLEYDGFAH